MILLFCTMGGSVAAATPAVLAAVADPARPAEQARLDQARHPLELLEFAGVRPGDRVLDFMPGNAYFTRLFSRLVGPRGRIYAWLPAEQLAHCTPDEVAGTRALAGDAHYANVRIQTGPASGYRLPQALDLIWIAQDYHDLHDVFMGPLDLGRFNAAVFQALKPGGTLLIIDHAAAAGSGLRDTESLHRIDPAQIVKEVTAAGFVLEAQSAVLRNPADTHDLKVFDPAIRYHTDQVVLKFRRPA
jgi:predicted methyltransferase